jgi:type IV pilus assembly protein PilW
MKTAGHFPRMAMLHSRGFSIVELMISVVIGMLAIMFATRMITGGEQNRQNALGGSDAMQNGMLAMYSISNDAAQAGFGLNDPLLAGCDTVFTDAKKYTLAQAKLGSADIQPLAAAVIESNAANPDRISMYSGSSLTGSSTVRLLGDYDGGETVSIDREPYGYMANDVIVVVPEQANSKCSLAQVSVKPTPGLEKPFLRFAATADTRFNTGALKAAFAGGEARVFNLGQGDKLAFHTWSVNNGFLQLSATDMAGSGAAPITIGDNIVSIKAQYGFDTRLGPLFTPETSTKVTQWSSTMINADGVGTTAGDRGDYQRIVALRLAVVARSKTAERPAADGTCSATAALPKVFATEEPSGVTAVPINVNVTVTGDTVDWKCYRYRVFETIVPIRNAAWRPTAW